MKVIPIKEVTPVYPRRFVCSLLLLLLPLLMALPVVIADDHHHVLPEIHLALRRRRLPFDGLHVLHVDAHPDLSFPRSIAASTVFQPEELYSMLDESPSGIAEFLLPLVFAGHAQQITWIKSPWANQMPVGSYRDITIGKRTADGSMALTCPLPHFLDDELYCEVAELETDSQRRWDLFVTEIDADHDVGGEKAAVLTEALATATSQCKAYILDIDLDYFSTWNPFLQELEGEFSREDLDTVQQVFSRLRYKRTDIALTVKQRLEDRHAFLAAIKTLKTSHDVASSRQDLVNRLIHLYPDDLDAETLLQQFTTFIDGLNTKQLQRVIVWAGPNMDLPHHESSLDEIADRVQSFRAFLDANSLDHSHPPALITIAKSSGDEFLPPHQADSVLEAVLTVLEHVFGPLDHHVIEYEAAEDVGE